MRVIFCIIMVMGFFFVLFAAGQLVKSKLSKSWPVVQGVINVERNDYGVNIDYSYEVDSCGYSSSRVIFGEFGNRRRGEDWRRFSLLNDGSKVDVYYMPECPRESTLVTGRVCEKLVYNVIFGMMFMAIGVFGVMVVGKINHMAK